jgi:hypothetical protein
MVSLRPASVARMTSSAASEARADLGQRARLTNTIMMRAPCVELGAWCAGYGVCAIGDVPLAAAACLDDRASRVDEH